ncbi:hypothetical protein [Lusitaniella coriacea]|nr:hypothetical protein [Lusitaniella coriacea]
MARNFLNSQPTRNKLLVAAWVGNAPKIIFDHYAGLLGIDVPEV